MSEFRWPEIGHHGGTLRIDPNQLAAMALIPTVITALLHPRFERRSDLSGELGAVLFSDPPLDVHLTVVELLDLIGHRLTPDQFRALRAKFGDNFWWHGDFYDQQTGEALQPRQSF